VAQTVRPERIIIVDDGSDDHASVEMLNATFDDRRHGAMDTNGVAIDLIGQANAGPSAARNRGIAATFVSHNCCPATCMIRRVAWECCGGYDESMRGGFEDWDFFLSLLECGLTVENDICGAGVTGGTEYVGGFGSAWDTENPAKDAAHIGIAPEPLIEYRTAPASSNVTSMTKRLDLMRFLIAKHRDLYAAHIADAILGVEAISMSRLTMWESLMCGDTTASPPPTATAEWPPPYACGVDGQPGRLKSVSPLSSTCQFLAGKRR